MSNLPVPDFRTDEINRLRQMVEDAEMAIVLWRVEHPEDNGDHLWEDFCSEMQDVLDRWKAEDGIVARDPRERLYYDALAEACGYPWRWCEV